MWPRERLEKGEGVMGPHQVWHRKAHWDAPGLDSHAGGSVALATLPRGSTGLWPPAGAVFPRLWVPPSFKIGMERAPLGLCTVV